MAKISSLLILTSNYLFSFGFTFGEFLSIHSMAAKQIEVLCLTVSSPPYLLLFLIFLPPMRFAHGKVPQVCPWVTAMPQQYLLPCGSSMHLSQNVFPLVSCSFRLLLFLTWVLTQATCSASVLKFFWANGMLKGLPVSVLSGLSCPGHLIAFSHAGYCTLFCCPNAVNYAQFKQSSPVWKHKTLRILGELFPDTLSAYSIMTGEQILLQQK